VPGTTHPTTDELLAAAARRLAPVTGLLTELGERFGGAGHELALVGGPVRDALLGRDSVDLDLTTDARPEETERLLRGWGDALWDVGRAFGTIGARKDGWQVEITTYRKDAYDRTSRKPEVTYGDRLEDDLVRRDFTVNAMALRLPDLTFVDPHDGLGDLARGLLRTPGTPAESFGDDPLRMMRAARFVSQLGLTLDPAVEAALRERAGSLEMISAERIRDELVKLMLTPDPRPGLEVLTDTGLADVMLPELSGMRLTVDEHNRHKDVYEHSLTVLAQAIDLELPSRPSPAAGDESSPSESSASETSEQPGSAAPADGGPVIRPDLVLRLAALLHDIGKPATRRFEPDGGVSFHHHELVGARMATKRLKALRFDKDTTKAVSRLIELHLRFHGYGDGEWTDSAVRRYVTDAGPLLSRLHLLTRADCTTRNVRKAARLRRSYDSLEQRIERLQEQEELAAVRPELDGNEIAEVLGIRPGPVLGRAYKHLLAVRLDEGMIGREEAATRLKEWWATQPESGPSD